MAMPLLPRFFVLKSGGKYLTVPKNLDDENLPPGFLKFDEEQIWSPRVKFAVEQAETGDGRLVHIRSCYNNKYWVASQIEELLWIVAAGQKPEEDESIDSCTLFEPFTSPENGTVGLCHVQTGNTLFNSRMFLHGVVEPLRITETLFNKTDWETLVILPPQISFKTLNGYYLCSRDIEWHPYQTFESELDVEDPLVAKVLLPTPDGNYRIKDGHFENFWRGSPNWIWADGDGRNNSAEDTIFSFVKIRDNIIAIRNLGNNKYCGRLIRDNIDCLSANYDIMSRETRLMVQEYGVLGREISDVKYRKSDSRIYQEEMKEVEVAFATNDSPEHESKVTLTFKTSDFSSTHWTNSESIKSELKVTVAVVVPTPYISVSGEVKYSKETNNFNEWKVSKITERTREASYTVVVPPMKTIKVTLMCSKGNCDVPFSYIQRDLLRTGERVTTLKDDGLFTGHNSYNYHFKSEVVTNDAMATPPTN